MLQAVNTSRTVNPAFPWSQALKYPSIGTYWLILALYGGSIWRYHSAFCGKLLGGSNQAKQHKQQHNTCKPHKKWPSCSWFQIVPKPPCQVDIITIITRNKIWHDMAVNCPNVSSICVHTLESGSVATHQVAPRDQPIWSVPRCTRRGSDHIGLWQETRKAILAICLCTRLRTQNHRNSKIGS